MSKSGNIGAVHAEPRRTSNKGLEKTKYDFKSVSRQH